MEEKSNLEVSKPKLPKYLTTVTTFSKILAMILFIALPFLGFYLGMRYQEQILIKTDSNNPTVTTTPSSRACTMEAKQCPDGSYVSRTGPNCEFKPCPTISPHRNDTLFDATKIKVGDVIAGMTVKEVKKTSEEDIAISFTGNSTVSGKIGQSRLGLMFTVDEDSLAKIPMMDGNSYSLAGWFFLTDNDLANSFSQRLQLDNKNGTTATITVNNFTIDFVKNPVPWADLVSVISSK